MYSQNSYLSKIYKMPAQLYEPIGTTVRKVSVVYIVTGIVI